MEHNDTSAIRETIRKLLGTNKELPSKHSVDFARIVAERLYSGMAEYHIDMIASVGYDQVSGFNDMVAATIQEILDGVSSEDFSVTYDQVFEFFQFQTFIKFFSDLIVGGVNPVEIESPGDLRKELKKTLCRLAKSSENFSECSHKPSDHLKARMLAILEHVNAARDLVAIIGHVEKEKPADQGGL